MAAWLAPAISAGASLLGGIFGRKSAKKQAEQTRKEERYLNENRISIAVADAKRAGINPLTAIRSGAANSINSNVTPPALSSSAFIADAIREGANTWFNAKEAEKDRDLERLKIEIARDELTMRENQQRIGQSFGYSIPKIVQTTQRIAHTAPQLTASPHPANRPIKPGREATRVMSDDGLTMANPEYSTDPETDLWKWAREGTIWENSRELWRRNAPPWMWSPNGRQDLRSGNLPQLEPFHSDWVREERKPKPQRDYNQSVRW